MQMAAAVAAICLERCTKSDVLKRCTKEEESAILWRSLGVLQCR
jgi:hypothetical protein